MKNVQRRINGLIRIAEKRQSKGSEIDKIVGKQVERNLKMARRIVEEEIITCNYCVHKREFTDAIDNDLLTLEKASIMYREGAECWCSLLQLGIPKKGFCHLAELDR